ncbi:MAG: metallopeptidase family protein [Actinomycetota bacterium]|nr:metallopeptidase family protein [Actinomycetota bacterium]
MVKMPGREEFEELVVEALEGFPEEFRRLVFDNLAVVVEDLASPEEARRAGVRDPMMLMGLYTGVPFTEWGRGYYMGPPDVIRIYRLPILAEVGRGGDVREKVRQVVLHELGHRAGLDEERLRELGVY